MSDLPLFVAVVLDDESRERLVSWFPAGLLMKTIAHHMTVKFKPSEADLAELNLGEQIQLQVIGWADNGHIQAVAVTASPRLPCANAVPHVTVATDGRTPPKFSNDLLEQGFTRVHGGPVLTGTLKGEGTRRS
jgi:hypothetical protein